MLDQRCLGFGGLLSFIIHLRMLLKDLVVKRVSVFLSCIIDEGECDHLVYGSIKFVYLGWQTAGRHGFKWKSTGTKEKLKGVVIKVRKECNRLKDVNNQGIGARNEKGSINVVIVKEFYANLYDPEDKSPKQVRVRGHLIKFDADAINTFLKTPVVIEEGESLPAYSWFANLRLVPQELASRLIQISFCYFKSLLCFLWINVTTLFRIIY